MEEEILENKILNVALERKKTKKRVIFSSFYTVLFKKEHSTKFPSFLKEEWSGL